VRASTTVSTEVEVGDVADTEPPDPVDGSAQCPSFAKSSEQGNSNSSGSPFAHRGQQKQKDPSLDQHVSDKTLAKQRTALPAEPEKEQRRRVEELYRAAVIADQNAKLSAFTTRPAINAPPFNWLTEFMATVMLITGSKLMSAQLTRQGLAGQAISPLYTGLFIACQVLLLHASKKHPLSHRCHSNATFVFSLPFD